MIMTRGALDTLDVDVTLDGRCSWTWPLVGQTLPWTLVGRTLDVGVDVDWTNVRRGRWLDGRGRGRGRRVGWTGVDVAVDVD